MWRGEDVEGEGCGVGEDVEWERVWRGRMWSGEGVEGKDVEWGGCGEGRMCSGGGCGGEDVEWGRVWRGEDVEGDQLQL